MKKTVFFLLLFLAVLAASKEVTAWRAHKFIMECTTETERAAITTATNDEQKRELYGMVLRTIDCVQSKQSLMERVISRTLGTRLFD